MILANVLEDFQIVSPDTKVVFRIKKGTKALTSDDKPIKQIKMKLIPRPKEEILPQDLSIMIGPVLYRIEPDGAKFDPPVELSYYYHDPDPNEETNEKNFMLSYYNYLSDGQFVAYETSVDTNKNLITAKVPHLSDPVPVSDCGSSAKTYKLEDIFVPNCDLINRDTVFTIESKKQLFFHIKDFYSIFTTRKKNEEKYLIKGINGQVIDYMEKCQLIQPIFTDANGDSQLNYPNDDPEKDLDKVLLRISSYYPYLCDETCKNKISSGDYTEVCKKLCTSDTANLCKKYFIKDVPDQSDNVVWRWSNDGNYYDSNPEWGEYFKTIKGIKEDGTYFEPEPDDKYKGKKITDDVFYGDGINDEFANKLLLYPSTEDIYDGAYFLCKPENGMKPATPKYAWGYENLQNFGGRAEFKFFFDENSCFNPHKTQNNKIVITHHKYLKITNFKINDNSYPLPEKGKSNFAFDYVDSNSVYELTLKVKENKYCEGTGCSQDTYIKEGENVVELEFSLDEKELANLKEGDTIKISELVGDGSVSLIGNGFKEQACTIDQRKTYLTNYNSKCSFDTDNVNINNNELTNVLNKITDDNKAIKTSSLLDSKEVKQFYAANGVELTTEMMFTCPTDDNNIVCKNAQKGCYDKKETYVGDVIVDVDTIFTYLGMQCIPTSPSDMTPKSGTNQQAKCSEVLGYEYEDFDNNGDITKCTINCQWDTSVCKKRTNDFSNYQFAGKPGSACVGGKPNGVLDKDEQCDPLVNPPTEKKCNQLDSNRYKDTANVILTSNYHCKEDCTWDYVARCDYLALGDSGKCTKKPDGSESVDSNEFCDIDDDGTHLLNGKTCTDYKGMPDIGSLYSGGVLKCKNDCTYDFSGCIKKESARCRIINGEKIEPPNGQISNTICSDFSCTCECKDMEDKDLDEKDFKTTCESLCQNRYGGKFIYYSAGISYRQVSNDLCNMPTCYDTDPNNDPTILGTVQVKYKEGENWKSETKTDECETDGKKTIEYKCDLLEKKGYTTETKDCSTYNSGKDDPDFPFGYCSNGVCKSSTVQARCDANSKANPPIEPDTYVSFTDVDGYTFETCCNDNTYCVGRDTNCYENGYFTEKKICNSGTWAICGYKNYNDKKTIPEINIGGTIYYCDLNTNKWRTSKIYDGKPIKYCGPDSQPFLINSQGEDCNSGNKDCVYLCKAGYFYANDYAPGKKVYALDGTTVIAILNEDTTTASSKKYWVLQ
ncbi:MAG: hypothetical protein QXE31_03050 [Candidatus Woesearchaeota archaeon]